MKVAISSWMERKRDRDTAALRRLERVQGAGAQVAQPMEDVVAQPADVEAAALTLSQVYMKPVESRADESMLQGIWRPKRNCKMSISKQTMKM